jgi:hypothetical protein
LNDDINKQKIRQKLEIDSQKERFKNKDDTRNFEGLNYSSGDEDIDYNDADSYYSDYSNSSRDDDFKENRFLEFE